MEAAALDRERQGGSDARPRGGMRNRASSASAWAALSIAVGGFACIDETETDQQDAVVRPAGTLVFPGAGPGCQSDGVVALVD
ncbi:hypothetical protein J2S89_000335 [Arthrobacter bambusae]|nr:hypothetical protein [Arthrobacter bambusae]MDQ0096679.1 hypothetical protein [Arthrobacter bambusae]